MSVWSLARTGTGTRHRQASVSQEFMNDSAKNYSRILFIDFICCLGHTQAHVQLDHGIAEPHLILSYASEARSPSRGSVVVSHCHTAL